MKLNELTLCLGLLSTVTVPVWSQEVIQRFNANPSKISRAQVGDLEERIAELEALVEQQQELLERLEGIIHITSNGTEMKVDVLKAGSSNRLRIQAADLDFSVEQAMTVQVGGNYTKTVDGDQAIQVGGNRSTTVSGDQAAQVGGTSSIAVSSSQTVAVGGSRTMTVSGSEALSVGADRTMIVDGNETISIGVTRTATVDKDVTTSVGGAHMLHVGDYVEMTVGNAVTSVKKDGSIVFEGEDIRFTGESIQIKASDEILIKGRRVFEK